MMFVLYKDLPDGEHYIARMCLWKEWRINVLFEGTVGRGELAYVATSKVTNFAIKQQSNRGEGLIPYLSKARVIYELKQIQINSLE